MIDHETAINVELVAQEEMAQYKQTARLRWDTERRAQVARHQRAWELARQAAALLQEQYGAWRVSVFGSLIHPGRFTRYSDVDLAVWGLTAANWLKASAAVRALSGDIELNLVDISCCQPELLAVIGNEGMILYDSTIPSHSRTTAGGNADD